MQRMRNPAAVDCSCENERIFEACLDPGILHILVRSRKLTNHTTPFSRVSSYILAKGSSKEGAEFHKFYEIF